MHGIHTAGRNPFSVFFCCFLFWLFVLVFFVLFWFVLSLMGLPAGLCIGPLPALLRLLTLLTALQANFSSACLLRLNVCNDLAKAMKALDGKKMFVLLQVRMVENRSCNGGCKCLFPVLQKARCFALTLLSPLRVCVLVLRERDKGIGLCIGPLPVYFCGHYSLGPCVN